MTITEQQAIKEIAENMSKQLETKPHEERGKYTSFTNEAIQSGNKYYRAMSDTIHELNLSQFFLYDILDNFLNWIIDGEYESIEDIQDNISEFADYVTPVYTSDLAEWLSESNYHVEYLGDAVRELGADDGFKILSGAYYLAAQEVAYSLLSVIEDMM